MQFTKTNLDQVHLKRFAFTTQEPYEQRITTIIDFMYPINTRSVTKTMIIIITIRNTSSDYGVIMKKMKFFVSN